MANPYNVAIQLALTSNHVGVLKALSAGLLGVIPHVNSLHSAFSRLGTAITGALGIVVGAEMISMLKNFTKETAGLSDELTKLKMAGLTGPQINQAQTEAIRVQKAVPGMTSVDVLKIIGQIYEPLGFENAIKVAESMAKFQTVMKSIGKGGFSDKDSEEMYKAIRSAEMMGKLTDPQTGKVDLGTLQKYLDTVAKFGISTHGRVTPSTWLNMAQQGGPALMNMSPEGLATMGQMSQMMGGFRAGTAMMSLFQQMAGGQMPKRTAMGMEELGLLHQGEWKSSGGGGAGGGVILTEEAKKRLTGLISNDPLKFAEELKKLMEAKGITGHDDQIRKIFEVLARQTTQRFTADELRNMGQIEQSRQRALGGLPVEGAMDALNEGSVTQNIKNVEAAWKEFQYALAGPNSENTIKMLHLLADGINYFTEKVRGMDPKTLEDLGKGIVVLTGALIGGGGAALVAAMGPVGWLVGGIVALTGALVAFKKDFENNETLKAIDQWGKRIAQAILGALDSVIAAIRGWLPSWLGGTTPPTGQPGSSGFLPPGNSLVPNRFGFVPDAGGPGPRTQGGAGSPPFIPKRMNYTPADQYGGYQNAIHTSGRGGGGANQPIIVSLNIDGRKISEALSATLAELMEFPNQAPYHDTYGGYTSNDSQFADT